MPTEILSKRVAALEACRLLHLSGELDNNLQPIGKESFHLLFSSEDIVLDESDLIPLTDNSDARPGTNKRRQYYKRKVIIKRKNNLILFIKNAIFVFIKIIFYSDRFLLNRLSSDAEHSYVLIRYQNGAILSFTRRTKYQREKNTSS